MSIFISSSKIKKRYKLVRKKNVFNPVPQSPWAPYRYDRNLDKIEEFPWNLKTKGVAKDLTIHKTQHAQSIHKTLKNIKKSANFEMHLSELRKRFPNAPKTYIKLAFLLKNQNMEETIICLRKQYNSTNEKRNCNVEEEESSGFKKINLSDEGTHEEELKVSCPTGETLTTRLNLSESPHLSSIKFSKEPIQMNSERSIKNITLFEFSVSVVKGNIQINQKRVPAEQKLFNDLSAKSINEHSNRAEVTEKNNASDISVSLDSSNGKNYEKLIPTEQNLLNDLSTKGLTEQSGTAAVTTENTSCDISVSVASGNITSNQKLVSSEQKSFYDYSTKALTKQSNTTAVTKENTLSNINMSVESQGNINSDQQLVPIQQKSLIDLSTRSLTNQSNIAAASKENSSSDSSVSVVSGNIKTDQKLLYESQTRTTANIKIAQDIFINPPGTEISNTVIKSNPHHNTSTVNKLRTYRKESKISPNQKNISSFYINDDTIENNIVSNDKTINYNHAIISESNTKTYESRGTQVIMENSYNNNHSDNFETTPTKVQSERKKGQPVRNNSENNTSFTLSDIRNFYESILIPKTHKSIKMQSNIIEAQKMEIAETTQQILTQNGSNNIDLTAPRKVPRVYRKKEIPNIIPQIPIIQPTNAHTDSDISKNCLVPRESTMIETRNNNTQNIHLPFSKNTVGPDIFTEMENMQQSVRMPPDFEKVEYLHGRCASYTRCASDLRYQPPQYEGGSKMALQEPLGYDYRKKLPQQKNRNLQNSRKHSGLTRPYVPPLHSNVHFNNSQMQVKATDKYENNIRTLTENLDPLFHKNQIMQTHRYVDDLSRIHSLRSQGLGDGVPYFVNHPPNVPTFRHYNSASHANVPPHANPFSNNGPPNIYSKRPMVSTLPKTHLIPNVEESFSLQSLPNFNTLVHARPSNYINKPSNHLVNSSNMVPASFEDNYTRHNDSSSTVDPNRRGVDPRNYHTATNQYWPETFRQNIQDKYTIENLTGAKIQYRLPPEAAKGPVNTDIVRQTSKTSNTVEYSRVRENNTRVLTSSTLTVSNSNLPRNVYFPNGIATQSAVTNQPITSTSGINMSVSSASVQRGVQTNSFTLLNINIQSSKSLSFINTEGTKLVPADLVVKPHTVLPLNAHKPPQNIVPTNKPRKVRLPNALRHERPYGSKTVDSFSPLLAGIGCHTHKNSSENQNSSQLEVSNLLHQNSISTIRHDQRSILNGQLTLLLSITAQQSHNKNNHSRKRLKVVWESLRLDLIKYLVSCINHNEIDEWKQMMTLGYVRALAQVKKARSKVKSKIEDMQNTQVMQHSYQIPVLKFPENSNGPDICSLQSTHKGNGQSTSTDILRQNRSREKLTHDPQHEILQHMDASKNIENNNRNETKENRIVASQQNSFNVSFDHDITENLQSMDSLFQHSRNDGLSVSNFSAAESKRASSDNKLRSRESNKRMRFTVQPTDSSNIDGEQSVSTSNNLKIRIIKVNNVYVVKNL